MKSIKILLKHERDELQLMIREEGKHHSDLRSAIKAILLHDDLAIAVQELQSEVFKK